MSKGEAPDSRGLIQEAYRMEGITEGECRSIFLDWALAVEGEVAPAIYILLTRHGEGDPDHPMTKVLREGLAAPAKPRRRGGWRRQER